ncbi:response regulator [soil metagenome]
MNDETTPSCILVVEDEMVLAMLIEDILGDAGYKVLMASRVPLALKIVESDTRVNAALLDINVAGKQVFPVAERLRDQGIPFAFASGYGDMGLPEAFRACPVLQKPYLPDALTSAVTKLLT